MSLTKTLNFLQTILCISALGSNSTAFANPTCTAAVTAASAVYDPFNRGNTFGVGNIQLDCVYVGLGSATAAYQILLSQGISNNYINRTMSYLGNRLIYNLYTNASHSIVWGNGTGGTSTVGDSYFMSAGTVIKNYPVYLRIPGAQAVNAGPYGDSITVTVNY